MDIHKKITPSIFNFYKTKFFSGILLLYFLAGIPGSLNMFAKEYKATTVLMTTDIEGIVNTYAIVTNILTDDCSDKILVDDPTSFRPGDKILIIQMQGAKVSTENSVNFGEITTIDNAGNYEFATILDVSGNIIDLKEKLANSYSPLDKIQLVRVPVYNDVNIIGPLTCQPWNGNTGGILAFEATGTVSLSANIDVSSKGFRGGNPSLNGYTCDYYIYVEPFPTKTSGQKGEGIAFLNSSYQSARGKLANGGGGGNQTNSGGGGGGNFNKGGKGGDQWGGCSQKPTGGESGLGLNSYYSNGRLFLGGGGGGGDQNNSVGTSGGNGGGIIIISAAKIEGNGFSISANGENAGNAGIDGAGGGGAAGSILMDVPIWTSNLDINVNGGKGGDTKEDHGPGGGGSGGFVGLSNETIPSGSSINIAGGMNGKNDVNTWGALPGERGIIVLKQFPKHSNPPEQIIISLETINICQGDSAIIFGNYESMPRKYSKIYNTVNGCDTVVTVDLNFFEPLSINSFIKNSCYGENDGSISLNVNSGNPPYKFNWSCSSLDTPTLSGLSPGICAVTVTDKNNCFLIDSFNLKSQSPPSYTLSIYTPCSGEDNGVIELSSADALSYSIDGVNFNTDGIFPNLHSGTYSISIQDAAFCLYDTIIQIDQPYEWSISTENDTYEINYGETVRLSTNADVPFLNYTWIPNEHINCSSCPSPLVTPTQPTEYLLVAKDSLGCTDSIFVSVIVKFSCDNIYIPNVFSPNDDGINDTFKAYKGTDAIKIIGLKIFDRWGGLMFSDDSENPGWDGRTDYKNDLAGVYVYALTYTCKEDNHTKKRIKKGDVTLIR